MSLSNLIDIKSFYRSPIDEIATNLYIPCLKNSVLFYRSAGFFSLSGLCDYFEGIIDLLKRGGEVKIITSPKLSEDEIYLLQSALDKQKIVVENILNQIKNERDYIQEEKLELLSYLIANEAIKVKIVYKETGLYHEKCGYFTDELNDSIWFIGSDNISNNALFSNTELTFVQKSWENQKNFSDIKALFEKAWYDELEDAVTIGLPEAIKNELLGDREPKNLFEAIKNYEDKIKNKKKVKELFKHQKEAIDYFAKNNYCGFLEMATGTGKTFTSCKIIEKVLKNEHPFTMVLVPQIDLQKQWDKELKALGLNTILFGGAGAVGTEVNKDITIATTNYYLGEPNVCISTYQTFFDKLLDKFKEIDNAFLIVDEAHNISNNQFKQLPNILFKLGLSATPIKHDLELSNNIVNYFTNGVDSFKYTIEDAIENNYLSHYNYYPIFIELDNDNYNEFDDFCTLTKQIATLLSKENLEKEDIEKIEKKANDRSLIIKKAVNKKKKLEELLNNQEEYSFKRTVVYCGAGKDADMNSNNKLIDSISKLLNSYGVESMQFTSDTIDRERVLEHFKDDFYDALVAMKCFDEGVDVPQLERIYIMSSERSIRQTIQRRGRVLRQCKKSGKTIGYIYDFVVLPPQGYEDSPGSQSLIKLEFERLHEYMRLSDNKNDYEREIKDIEDSCGLIWDEERGCYGKEFEEVDGI